MKRKLATNTCVSMQNEKAALSSADSTRTLTITLPEKQWLLIDLMNEHGITKSLEEAINDAINNYMLELSLCLTNIKKRSAVSENDNGDSIENSADNRRRGRPKSAIN